MSESAFTIGPRQTVDRVKHPDLGEGRLVYDNGPAAFIADSGEVVPLVEANRNFGSKDCGKYSYTIGVTAEGRRVEFDCTGRKHGESHRRIVTFEGVHGWMVDMVSKSGGVFRFEPDDGDVELHSWSVAHVGTPDEYKKQKSNKGLAKLLRESKWVSRDKFVYCRECDYVAPTPKPAPVVQGDLFGGKDG